MQDFVDRHSLGGTVLVDGDGSVFGRFGVPAQPAWAFVAADGAAETTLGVLDDAELDTTIDDLLR